MRRVLLADAIQLPIYDFVLPGLPRGSVGLMVGQGGIGKSFLALQIAVGVSLGRAIGEGTGGEIFPAPPKGATACIFGEDPPAILQGRLHGIRQGLAVDDIAVVDRSAQLVSAVGEDLSLVKKGLHGQLLPGPFASQLRELATGKHLVILDPLVQLIGGCNENDNGEMSYLMCTLAAIAAQTNAAILVLHHVGKSREGAEDWELPRGASALTTNARLLVNLRPPSSRECAALGMSDADRGDWVRISVAKANYASELRKLRAPRWSLRTANGLLQAHEPTPIRVGPTLARTRGRNVDPI